MDKNFITDQDLKIIKLANVCVTIGFILALGVLVLQSLYDLVVLWQLNRHVDFVFLLATVKSLAAVLLCATGFILLRMLIRACENIAKLKFVAIDYLNKHDEQ